MKKLVVFLVLCLVGIVIASTTYEATFRDGTGNSNYVKVDSDYKVKASVVGKTKLFTASLKGDSYSWTCDTNDIDATDTALLVANTSASRKLVIDSVYIWADAATQVQIHCPQDYTWAGNTDVGSDALITGVNLNRASAKAADATAYKDETGNTQGSIVVTLHTNELGTDQFGCYYSFGDSVILKYNQAIGVDLVSETAALQCTIVGYYID